MLQHKKEVDVSCRYCRIQLVNSTRIVTIIWYICFEHIVCIVHNVVVSSTVARRGCLVVARLSVEPALQTVSVFSTKTTAICSFELYTYCTSYVFSAFHPPRDGK